MTDFPAQAAAIAFLSDPAHHGGCAVDRIDTHISSVFLAGDHAWKLKKAVRLPFLDFTELSARETACRAELEVNSRNAPDLYLGLSALTRNGDGLELDGAGEIVDWVVRMRRFEQSDVLAALLSADAVDRALAQQTAEAIAESHSRAPLLPHKDPIAGLEWTIRTNAESMLRHADILPADKIDRLSKASEAELTKRADLLRARKQAGFMRRCHGDLHCGNICVHQGRPVLFDALEFSEDIAGIDVFYDLAFLLMDLHHRGAGEAAAWVQNHYLDLTGDYQGMIALPLFLSLRAAIRAHVTATMAAAAGDAAQAGAARAYLDRALEYLAPPPPQLLAVGGLSGSGKSRMGRECARFLGVPAAAVVRTDSLRKQAAGIGLLEKLPPQSYTPEESARTYARMNEICRDLLENGVSAVADAVFAKPQERAAIENTAQAAGAEFHGLWLETAPETAINRIRTRKANVSDADESVLRAQLSMDLGPMTWTRIDTGGSKPAALEAGMRAIGAKFD